MSARYRARALLQVRQKQPRRRCDRFRRGRVAAARHARRRCGAEHGAAGWVRSSCLDSRSTRRPDCSFLIPLARVSRRGRAPPRAAIGANERRPAPAGHDPARIPAPPEVARAIRPRHAQSTRPRVRALAEIALAVHRAERPSDSVPVSMKPKGARSSGARSIRSAGVVDADGCDRGPGAAG